MYSRWPDMCPCGRGTVCARSNLFIHKSKYLIAVRVTKKRNVDRILLRGNQAFLYSTIWQDANRSLRWRRNGHDDVSNHQPHHCLLNRLFRPRSKKTLKLRVTGLCVGNSPGPANYPHKGPVTRRMFPFDDVIMCFSKCWVFTRSHSAKCIT